MSRRWRLTSGNAELAKDGIFMPENLRIVFSMGGTEDALIDPETDRHADVFPTLKALEEAGYTDQGESDLLAVTLPTTRIGIVANRIPQLRRRQGAETFASLQRATSARVALRRAETNPPSG